MSDKRQRLDLPFIRRRKDIGTVMYDHRAGVFAVVVLALVMGIVFVASRVIVGTPKVAADILVDLRTVEELREEARRLEREVRLRQMADGGAVSNAVSNEAADLRDDRNTDMSQVRGLAEDADSRMSANRDAWDRGLREIENMRADRGDERADVNRDSRAKGRVMVSFSITNPTRYSENLVVPGYRCERGGEVVVTVTLNRSGDVVSAAVDKGLSDGDGCMHETALDAARRSRFNLDAVAPERQTGTITYTFIPQ